MSDFNFNDLHDGQDHGEQHDHLGTTGSASGDSLPALDTHSIDTPEVTSSTSSGKHGKHGKKDHPVEPAPAPEAVDVGDVDLSTPLAPTYDASKGFLRYLPDQIKTLNAKGVPFKLDGATGNILVDGFYRSGGITLEIGDGDSITAVDRRGVRTPVNGFDDLVALNHDWWIRTNGKNGEGRITPDRPWLDEFLEKGWIKRVVIFVPREDAKVDSD